MSNDDTAIEALRRLDRPHDLDSETIVQIEGRLLDHFDVAVRPAASTDAELIELSGFEERGAQRRRGVLSAALVAAAVAAVVGAIVLVASRADEAEVPGTAPEVSIGVDAQVREQVRAYCNEFVKPVRETSDAWSPDGFGSEARRNLLIAVEQAAQGLADLPLPAASRFPGAGSRLLDQAAEARRSMTVGLGGDEALVTAREAIFTELEAVTVTSELPDCARS